MDNNAVVEKLQAELQRITDDRDAKSSRMWELGKQCDALEEELTALKQSLAQPAVFKDGNSWCAVWPDFIDIQVSECAFDDTPEGAVRKLWACAASRNKP